MRASKLLRLWIVLPLAVLGTAATGQVRLCSTVPLSEREALRSIGACRDGAPIIDVVPSTVEPQHSAVVAVPAVVGLGFDDARNRLAGFSVRRSYRPSAEPGGTVLEQQPAAATRLAAGAIVRLVLSDGTLRPPPRVSAAEIDGVPNPAASQTGARPQPAVTSGNGRAGEAVEQSSAGPSAQSSSATPLPRTSESQDIGRLIVPNVGGMTFRDAQDRLANFRVQRRERPSSAPLGRVVEQIPSASSRAPLASVVTLVVSSGPARAPTPVIETFEMPNVVGRSYGDASAALSEFKVTRIEKASEAPSGQVLAQEPAPNTAVAPGSAVGLQVSDGSLAGAARASAEIATPVATAGDAAPAAATPAIEAAPAPAATAAAEMTTPAAETTAPAAATSPTAAAPVPAQSNRLPVTFPSSATLLLIAGVLFGLGLGALLTRRWFLGRQSMEDLEPVAPAHIAPEKIDVLAVPVAAPVAMPVAESAPKVKFTSRLDGGETTIEFAAPADADETTMEHSRELHE